MGCGIVPCDQPRFSRFDAVIAALVSGASGAVVLWQNSRLAVLWDVSYILENAARIAAGDVPYRDFPFPYAPLTFLVQAAIIRIFGRVYWHHIAYATIACAAATALTYFIARRFASRAIAAAFTVPLALLGTQCIFPHPFYDPDCCLVLLVLAAALLAGTRPMLVGALCVTPLLVKQNIGIAFVAALFLLLLIERKWRTLTGVVIGSAAALAFVGFVFGLGNYARWTLEFAAQRRMPPLALMAGIYDDPTLWWQIAVVLVGVFVSRAKWLIAVPWLWTAWRFFATDDPNEREINLLRAWPLVIVVAVVVVVSFVWHRHLACASCEGTQAGSLCHTENFIALLLIAAIHGAFLSQQTWGSTYAIWPLLILLMVFAFRDCGLVPACVIAAIMLLSASDYVRNESRLTYVKWRAGAPATSRLSSLRGLRMRGPWLPDFDELVAWTDRNVPRDDAILSIPGEDLFYFATGRRPRVPVVMFDRTINPYSPDAIAAIAAERGVRWVIVKRYLQLNGTPYPELGDTIHRLRNAFEPVAFLRNYVVFRRSSEKRQPAG